MRYSHKVKQILVENKEGLTLEDFVFNFYRKLRTYNIAYTKGHFDEVLEILFNKDPEEYSKCFEAIKESHYGFLKNNLDIIIDFINKGCPDNIKMASDMMEYRNILISRNLPNVYLGSVLKEKKSLILKVKNCLISLQSEDDDNILKKAQKDFKEKYGIYENDLYLKELYNNILNSFEDEMKKSLQASISKIEGISDQFTQYRANAHVVDTIFINKKDSYNSKNRVR